MLRALKYVAVIALVVAGAIWLAERPGEVSMVWQGYRIDMPVAVLLLAIAAVAVAAALLYRLWGALRAAPERISTGWHERKRRKGYVALTRGMVAVAAGDGAEAARQAKKAEVLLEDPPLTMLLSAQAAQLAGDERAAETFFEAMRGRPEMEFLGLRGRINQAIRQDDRATALALAKKAFGIRPKTRWVAETLFDLHVRAGHWTEALEALKALGKVGAVDDKAALRRRAVLSYLAGVAEAEAGGTGEKSLRAALKAAPDLIPAALFEARRLRQAGRDGKAMTVIEEAWRHAPHPELAALYRDLAGNDPLARYRGVSRLAGFAPEHPESRMLLAEAALAADLWGEARKHLAALVTDAGPVRAYRLMAEVEEAELKGPAAAGRWLRAAAQARPDPVWTCDHCGNVLSEWAALCPRCGTFDAYRWQAPRRPDGGPIEALEADPRSALPAV